MKATTLLTCLSLLLLTACSAESEPGVQAENANQAEETSDQELTEQEAGQIATSIANGNTQTIRALMNTEIQPHADTLWKAVRYVVNADGVEEDIAPQTDADWQRLADSALALVAAGDALLAPNLQAAPAPPDAAFKYTGEEIQELLALNPEPWRYYVKEMQFATSATLETILNRDLIGLMETGASINNACNGCHAQFWYRPLDDQGQGPGD